MCYTIVYNSVLTWIFLLSPNSHVGNHVPRPGGYSLDQLSCPGNSPNIVCYILQRHETQGTEAYGTDIIKREEHESKSIFSGLVL